MQRFRFLWILGMFTVLSAASRIPFGALLAQNTSECQYEVLSPWAEADPIPLKGISPRLDTLTGKNIGLFANYKRAALPIAASLQKRLKAMYPDSEVSLYHSSQWNVTEIETENKDQFTEWVNGMDAVILVVGD